MNKNIKSNTPVNTTNSILFLTFPDIRRQAPPVQCPPHILTFFSISYYIKILYATIKNFNRKISDNT